ncbi:MAG: pyruvate kinase [Solirubrobacteraceae bacterium]
MSIIEQIMEAEAPSRPPSAAAEAAVNGGRETGAAVQGSARPDREPVVRPCPARRRTKIVATLGPSTDGRIGELIEAGMDCARLNCSHGSAEELRSRCTELRAAARMAGRPVAVMFDLQGPKIRLDASIVERDLRAGEEVVLTVPGEDIAEPGALCVAYPQLPALVSERSEIVIGDGAPRLRVTGIDQTRIRALTVIGGRVSSRKGVNITHAQPKLPAITDKDRADARVAVECEADFIALSFVRSAEDVCALRELLAELGSEARVVAKIEKVEALEHLDAIVQAADAVMVARGDYGVEAGIPQVPAMQKDTIRCAGRHGKLVITATQMLESMTSCPLPTRAEAADVFNAVVDGTSAVMLSAETGVGAYPLEAVRTMADIALCAEQQDIYCEPHTLSAGADGAVMHAAVALARDTNAAALVVPSSRGGTVRACARYRPRRPIYALCDNERVARQLNLEWGVYPSIFEHPRKAHKLLKHALCDVTERHGLSPGTPVVITAGPRIGTSGATNLITLRITE